jgi:hypothetical protein
VTGPVRELLGEISELLKRASLNQLSRGLKACPNHRSGKIPDWFQAGLAPLGSC